MNTVTIDYASPKFRSGYYRQALRRQLQERPVVDEVWLEELSSYYLRAWESDYAAELLSGMTDGVLHHQGTDFSVCYYKGTTPAAVKNMKRGDGKVSFSFRAAKPEWNLHPVVLVRIWQGKE